MHAEDVLTTVLSRPSYGGRARSLRRRRHAFTLELVDGFVARAHRVLRSDPSKARQLARLGLYVARALDENDAQVRCLRALAQAGLLSGHLPEALRAIDEALRTAQPAGDLVETAELDALRVQILTQLERFEEARAAGERVLQVFEQAGQLPGILRAHMALADLARQLGQPRIALRHYAEVDRRLPATTKPRFRGALAANRANALQARNRFRAAARWYEQARAIFVEDGDCDHTVAQMDYNLARNQVLRGNYREALRRLDEVEAAFATFEDGMHLAHVDLDRAEIHLLLNLPTEAGEYARRAAARFAALGLTRDRAQAEYFAGRAAALLGDLDAAGRLYADARREFAAAGVGPQQIQCIVQQAYAAHRLGRSGAAQLLAEEAGALLGPTENPLITATVDLLRANLQLAAGREEGALSCASAVLAHLRNIYAPWVHVEALRVVGTARRRLGRDDEAILAFEEAVGLLERHRGGVPPDEYMSAFLSSRSALYAQLADLLVRRGDDAAALEVCERAKARSLLDLLAREPAPREAAEASPRIRFLREALSAVYWHLFRTGGGADPAAAEDMAAKHAEASALEAELSRLLRARSLTRGGRPAPSLVAVPTLAELQAGLDARTALIEYLRTEDAVITFVVTRDDLKVARRAVAPGELERGLLRFRFHLAKHERPEVTAPELVARATRANLVRLREILLDPIAADLDVERLVIAPDGVLHALPFHALPWGEGWLADRYEVVSIPSAAVYLQCHEAKAEATGEAAVFGVPDRFAPEIEAECMVVARTLGTPHLHLREGATWAALRRAAPEARILHIATHGMFRPEHPTLSGIRLHDRWVTLHDLYALRFAGAMVVLSTCESGTAGVTRSGDVMGLTRGLFGAGAPTILCSQWRVRDGVTAAFMTSFYKALAADHDVAAAHRSAMAEIRRRHPHPYYWAPFFLMGCPAAAPTPTPIREHGARLELSIEGNA